MATVSGLHARLIIGEGTGWYRHAQGVERILDVDLERQLRIALAARGEQRREMKHHIDLVMSGDRNTEIDLTRVQMLVFTSIAAVFTLLTLINTGKIPDIPVGVLALVGLSNGVYIASKAATPRT